jgi:hypothetical protein
VKDEAGNGVEVGGRLKYGFVLEVMRAGCRSLHGKDA